MFKNLSFSNQDIIAGIEINDSWLKIIVTEKKGRDPLIRSVVSVEIKGKDEREIANTIADIFKELKLKPSAVYGSIPREFATVRYLSLPSTEGAEINEMIGFQAENLLPYSRDEMVLDHLPLGIDENGYTKIMLIVIPRNTINKYLNIFYEAGLNLNKLTLTSEASSLLLSKRRSNPGSTQETIAYINIDHLSTDISVVADKSLIYTRNISLGSAQKNQENIHRRFIDEFNRSFTVYEKESMGPKLERLILSKSVLVDPDFIEKIKDILPVPVEVVDPLEEIPREVLSGFEDIRDIVSLTVPLGLVAAPEEIKLNLMPGTVKTYQISRKFRKKMFMSFLVFVPMMALLFSLVLKGLYDRNRALKQINAEIERNARVVSGVGSLKSKLNIVRNEIGSVSALEVLKELYRITPADIYLKLFSYEKGGSVMIQGSASDLAVVTNFMEMLKRSRYFKNAKIGYVTKRRVRYRLERMDFEIRCPLS